MIARFSLYGFLKNQRYFEPFLMLALLDKGASYAAIGLLVGYRELIVNVVEVPSGVIADLFGRRGTLMLSFAAYIVGFIVFGAAEGWPGFVAAMTLIAVGDAFRSGTHKAMIFTWLRLNGRTDERTKVYGYTRSWSKLGSAVSVVVAAVFVFVSDSYTYVFYISAVPYVLGMINFLGYPKALDGERALPASISEVTRHLFETAKDAFGPGKVRRLLLESMGFEGTFHAVKDYLQPILAVAAVAVLQGAFADEALTEIQRSTLLVGPVYFVLYLASSAASRHAHVIVDNAGGEDAAARRLWAMALALFIAVGTAEYFEWRIVTVGAFILLHVAQNVWRPTLVSRFGADGATGATLLSVESQARRLGTMLLAPVIGFAVDQAAQGPAGGAYWPLGALGAVIAGIFWVTARPSASPFAVARSEHRAP